MNELKVEKKKKKDYVELVQNALHTTLSINWVQYALHTI